MSEIYAVLPEAVYTRTKFFTELFTYLYDHKLEIAITSSFVALYLMVSEIDKCIA